MLLSYILQQMCADHIHTSTYYCSRHCCLWRIPNPNPGFLSPIASISQREVPWLGEALNENADTQAIHTPDPLLLKLLEEAGHLHLNNLSR